MRPKWKLYSALGLMVFFLIGLTIEILTRKNVANKKTILTMETTYVELPNGLSNHTIDEFYQGMSLALDASILLEICIFVLSLSDTKLTPSSKAFLLVIVIFWTATISALSFLYIFPVPTITFLLTSFFLIGEWHQNQLLTNSD
ncbi:LIC_13387 family protein [Leptospira ellinghausenii]|uniref:LIC_13387 family protein n=1 Tax=Leptospira ellinghausenii TaxID=1917822 RepID=UPI000D59B12F